MGLVPVVRGDADVQERPGVARGRGEAAAGQTVGGDGLSVFVAGAAARQAQRAGERGPHGGVSGGAATASRRRRWRNGRRGTRGRCSGFRAANRWRKPPEDRFTDTWLSPGAHAPGSPRRIRQALPASGCTAARTPAGSRTPPCGSRSSAWPRRRISRINSGTASGSDLPQSPAELAMMRSVPTISMMSHGPRRRAFRRRVERHAAPEAAVQGQADRVLLDVIDADALRLDAAVVLEHVDDHPRALVLVLQVRRVDEDQLVGLHRQIDVFLKDGGLVAGVLVEADLADAEDVGLVRGTRG